MTMTGREKIEAALSREGTAEVPIIICYEGIYLRDHWEQLTQHPWWYKESPDIQAQLSWYRDAIHRTGQDSFLVPTWYNYTREDWERISIEATGGNVFRIDRRTGQHTKLEKPHWGDVGQRAYIKLDPLPETREAVDATIPISTSNVAQSNDDEAKILSSALLSEFGTQLYPFAYTGSPLWGLYNYWGFEGMMMMVALRPDLVAYACDRLLTKYIESVRRAALLGAKGIWVEDCLTDMISHDAYARLNMPFIRQLVEEIRSLGMKSVHYFCGDPKGKLAHILATGSDAIAFEESKKGFTVEIEEIVDRVRGTRTVFGNLDAINILQDGSKDMVRAEVMRQIAAGRRNGSRFIMCLGSPVTPATPVSKVQMLCDIVHEIGVA